MDLLQKYTEEIAKDLTFDELSLRDLQLKLPGRKHYWVARLINHKRELEQLKTKKNEIYDQLTKKLIADSPVVLSKSDCVSKISNLSQIKELNQQIKELELVIELLEKTEKTFSETVYSIKNVVQLMQLEQL